MHGLETIHKLNAIACGDIQPNKCPDKWAIYDASCGVPVDDYEYGSAADAVSAVLEQLNVYIAKL